RPSTITTRGTKRPGANSSASLHSEISATPPRRAREVRIDDALRRAARGRQAALVHRHITARDVAAHIVIDLQADRVSRIVSLRSRRHGREHRRDYEDRTGYGAHGKSPSR